MQKEKLKNGDIFRFVETNETIIFDGGNLVYELDKGQAILCELADKYVAQGTFELLEETEEIDIDSIEEYDEYFIENSACGEDVKSLARNYNKLAKAIKQINNKINNK